jgi:hypothetical protein
VISVGESSTTNFVPIPVFDAIEVALPTLVIGPVKLALVVTVPAVVAVAAFPPIFKLATGVVEVTINGAVPIATVDTNTLPDTLPVVAKLVPVAAPMFGVIKVGESSTTNFVPIPVFDAIDVALPTLVIGPVRFALVTTVVALPTLVTIPVKLALVVTFDANVAVAALPPIFKFATGVVEVTTSGAVPVAIVDVN